MIESNSAEVNIKVGEIEEDEYLPQEMKDQKIKQLRNSLVIKQGGDSSFKVVTNLANTMVGSSIIVYPIMFIKDGVIGALLVLLAIGAALYSTCRLLLQHNRPDQIDFGEQVKRILGKRWALLNSVVNITLIFMVSISYFMLICSNFFDISASIIEQISSTYARPPAGQIDLTIYSVQYASLISMLFVAPFLFRKDIEVLMKFFKYTIYFVLLYGIFVGVAFIMVLFDGNLDFSQYHTFDPDFSTVAGAFALSLLIHPVGAPILKRNVNQKNNNRDLFLGYCLTAVIYVYVGFIGAMTCAKDVTDIYENQNKYETIFDCFRKKPGDQFLFITGKVVQLGIFLQNLSVMPILSFITRKQFMDLFESNVAKKRAYLGYTITVIVLCLIVTFFEVDVSIILSLDGAIVGFFMAYAIPITTHLVCYHKKLTKQEKLARTELLLSTGSQTETDAQIMEQALKCNKHKPKSKMLHYIVYGALMAMGFTIGCFKIYAMFETKETK